MVIRVNPSGPPTPLQIIPPPNRFNPLTNPNPQIIEWRHVATPPVIELSSSDDESDWEDEEPYGPFYDIGDVRAYVDLRRSKRIWKKLTRMGASESNTSLKGKKKGKTISVG